MICGSPREDARRLGVARCKGKLSASQRRRARRRKGDAFQEGADQERDSRRAQDASGDPGRRGEVAEPAEDEENQQCADGGGHLE